jgi:Flp pilus assembly protein TadG
MKKLVFQFRKFEKAQILPIVAIGMVAIIGLAAILLDGGVLLANRRSAQAAADAGALAGARLSCLEKTKAEIEAEAWRYAVNLNNADASTTATYDSGTGLVTVVAQKQQNSWFARIFGEDTLSAGASASAGCYFPSVSSYVLPLAFYYQTPPIKAGAADCGTDGTCALVNWDFTTLMNTLTATSVTNLPLDDIYIVADKIKICEKGIGTIVCAEMRVNDSGGNRQWINLTEVAGTSNLQKVIKYGLIKPLYTPAWINASPGADTSVFRGDNFQNLAKVPGYENYLARLVNVPLFTDYCPDMVSCSKVVSGDRLEYLVNNNQPAYRLAGFAPFVVTCVTMSSKCEFGNCIPAKTGPNTTNKPICPGYLASNPDPTKDKENDNAIEGYFVDGLPADMYTWGTGGVDAGIYIISLSD